MPGHCSRACGILLGCCTTLLAGPAALSYLPPVVERARLEGMPPSDRVNVVERHLANAKEMLSTAPRSTGGGSGASDADYTAGAGGYSAAQISPYGSKPRCIAGVWRARSAADRGRSPARAALEDLTAQFLFRDATSGPSATSTPCGAMSSGRTRCCCSQRRTVRHRPSCGEP